MIDFVIYKYNPTAADGSTVNLRPIVNSEFAYNTVTQTADDGNKLVALRSDESDLSYLTSLQFGGVVASQYLISVDDLNVSTLTTAEMMFYSCYNLKTLDLSNFNTSNVTNMSNMFADCHSLKTLDLSNFDTSNVTNMDSMFYLCSSLTSLDISNWDTSNVTSKFWMFNNCTSLRIIKCNNAATINKITNELPTRTADAPGYIVTTCAESDLDTAALSSKGWNVTNEEPELEPEPEPVMIDFVKYTFNPTATDGSTVDLIPTMTSIAYTKTDVTNADGTITRALSCEEAYLVNLKKLQFGNVTGSGSLISVDELNVPSLNTAYYMFYNCTNLVSVNTENFNTSNITDMTFMFYGCQKLKTIGDVSNWNTSKVTNMEALFSNCLSLTSLDLSNWNTSKVTNMSSMFKYCPELKVLDISNFNINNSTKTTNMLAYCNNIKDIGMIYCDQYTVDTVAATTYNTKKTIWVKEDIVQEELINSCTYKVYKENSKTITLNEPLRAIGDIRDRFVKRDGKWYVERNCGEANATGMMGTLACRPNSPSRTAYERRFINNMKANSGITLLICDKFKPEQNINEPYRVWLDDINIHFTFPSTVNTSDKALDELNGVKFIYLLEEPTYEEIEDPTLLAYSDSTSIFDMDSIPANLTVRNASYSVTGIKPLTQYTVICDTPGYRVYLGGAEVTMKTNTALITTPEVLVDTNLLFYGTGKVGNVILIEGDYSNNDFEYFTGSVEVGKKASGKYTFVEIEEEE